MELSNLVKSQPLPTADIGGTDTATVAATTWGVWLDTTLFRAIFAHLKLGTFNATDELDHVKLQQAKDAAGTGAKDLTTSASGGDYDTDSKLGTAGDEVILEARAEDMDRANGFKFVRVYASEADNTDVDQIYGVLMLHNGVHDYKHQLGAEGATRKYVSPGSRRN